MEPNALNQPGARKRFILPHGLALLTIMIFIAVVASWYVPAGQFERIKNDAGQTVVVPGSYQVVESRPATLWQGWEAILGGCVAGASIAFADFLIGGAFGIVQGTGIIQGGVYKAVRFFGARYHLAIMLIMISMITLCNFIGLSELSMVVIPIMIPMCLALGLDSLTAMAMTSIAACVGFTTGIANPFTVVISQNLVGMELYSGSWYRLIVLALAAAAGILYVLAYARKIKADPAVGIMYERDKTLRVEYGVKDDGDMDHLRLNKRQTTAGISFLIGFVIMVYGCMTKGWGLSMIASVLLLNGVCTGFIAGMNVNTLVKHFLLGLQKFVIVAFAVGIARGTLVILQNTYIIDTIVNAVAGLVQMLPSTAAAVGMLTFQFLFNSLVPSGSGQALLTMPIMFPIADLVGVTQQTAILAFQYGDGFSNLLWPTVGSLWGYLALIKLDYSEWLKFIAPLMIVWYVIAVAAVFVAQFIQLG